MCARLAPTGVAVVTMRVLLRGKREHVLDK